MQILVTNIFRWRPPEVSCSQDTAQWPGRRTCRPHDTTECKKHGKIGTDIRQYGSCVAWRNMSSSSQLNSSSTARSHYPSLRMRTLSIECELAPFLRICSQYGEWRSNTPAFGRQRKLE